MIPRAGTCCIMAALMVWTSSLEVSPRSGPCRSTSNPANWQTHGKRAGPIRNREMVATAQPNMCFVFPRTGEPNKGTLDFVRACIAAQVDFEVIWLPSLVIEPGRSRGLSVGADE